MAIPSPSPWMLVRTISAALLFGAVAASPAITQASEPSLEAPALTVGPGVDTLGKAQHDLLVLWRSYLNERPYTYEPKRQWSSVEQRRWPIFDLAMPAVYQSAAEYQRTRATVVALDAANPGDSSVFVIRTLFTSQDSASGRELPVALTRVYAVREGGAWVLANALTRLTADWRRTVMGPITFIYPRDHRFDPVLARHAVRFADSLATVFGAPHPKGVTYYLARSPEEAFRISGVDFARPGTTGRSFPGNYMIFSGLPAYGEFYPHELTHLTLGWLPGLPMPPVLDEGLAFWLGGSRGRSWPELRADLAVALQADSSLTLSRLLAERPATDPLRSTAAGGLLQLAHERGGVSMVKRVLSPAHGPTARDILRGAEDALGCTRAELEAGWRQLIFQKRVSSGP